MLQMVTRVTHSSEVYDVDDYSQVLTFNAVNWFVSALQHLSGMNIEQTCKFIGCSLC